MRAKTCLIFRSSLSAGMTTDTEENSMNPPHDWYPNCHQTCQARPNSSLTTAAHQRKLFYPASCPQDRKGMVIRMKRVPGTHGLCITDLAPNRRQAFREKSEIAPPTVVSSGPRCSRHSTLSFHYT